MKSADALDLITMLPLIAAERPQGNIDRPFQIHFEFQPARDQPQAIEELSEEIAGERDQVLPGVTGAWCLTGRSRSDGFDERRAEKWRHE
jgi:hypothetical protein